MKNDLLIPRHSQFSSSMDRAVQNLESDVETVTLPRFSGKKRTADVKDDGTLQGDWREKENEKSIINRLGLLLCMD